MKSKIKSDPGNSEDPQENKKNYTAKDLAYIIAIVAIAVFTVTFSINNLVGGGILRISWYWMIILSVVGLFLFGLWTNKVNKASLRNIFITTLVISVFMVPIAAFFGEKNSNFKELKKWATTDTTPPRDVTWMNRQITAAPQQILKVYNGDEVEYISPNGFWVIEGYSGRKFFHNPCTPGETRSFSFYELPQEGTTVSIYGQGGDSFEMRFRISQHPKRN